MEVIRHGKQLKSYKLERSHQLVKAKQLHGSGSCLKIAGKEQIEDYEGKRRCSSAPSRYLCEHLFRKPFDSSES